MFNGYTKSVKMNDWIRNKCKPSSEGLLVTDIDFMFFDYKKKKFMMIETKTFNAKMKLWQEQIYKKINNSLKADKDYLGFHLIMMSGECPETSEEIMLNSKKITKEQLIQFFNFELDYESL